MIDQLLVERARQYAERNAIELSPAPLGFGDDGAVWTTSRHTVIKAFQRPNNYAHELECYQRLADAGIRKIREFEVPALLNHDDPLWIIEMGFVNPPFILDFGKAYLADPRFPEHVIEEWNERMRFWWGDEVKRVRLALFALRRYGIWYYDAKPGNVALENWNPSVDG
jgi:hypothetical protein